MEFTAEQQNVINAIMNGDNIFITGPGGTGKTTIIRHIAAILDVGVTAMTGAAAVLINGQTLHSFLGIGLGKGSVDELVKRINGFPKVRRVWRDLERLVIDEVSMMSAELFEKLNEVGKEVRANDKPFGGIQLILSGDFLQLPCVKGQFCFESGAWEECKLKVFHLTTIMRQDNTRFQECLNKARFGVITQEDIDFITQSRDEPGEHPNQASPDQQRIKPTKIFCYNADVDALNQSKLDKLCHEHEKNGVTETNGLREFNAEIVTRDLIIKDITKFCNAQPTLQLAVGAQVMLLVNRDVELHLVNGSRGVVVGFDDDDLPIVRFKHATITIDFHAYEIKEHKKTLATIFQIPLKLAYAITVHKSQGVTLDAAMIDLNGVFEFGQAYVALSRVRDTTGVELFNASPASFRAHPKALAFYNHSKPAPVKKTTRRRRVPVQTQEHSD